MNLPQLPKAVVFDMDGLLFDTEALYQEAIMAAATAAGHEMPASVFMRLVGSPWVASRRMLIEHYGEAFDIDALWSAWMQNFEALITDRQFIKSGVIGLLDTLDALGLPAAIATSSSHATVQRHLAAHGLTGRFPHIVGHGDYANGKPAPDPFLLTADLLGVAPGDCLALEDSFNGIRSAASAGMMTVMVPDILKPTDEITALCVMVAEDLSEVERLISRAANAGIKNAGRASSRLASQTVLFDLDGTLVDSQPGILASCRAALRALGHESMESMDLEAIIGPPMEEVMRTLLIPYRDNRVAEGVAAYRADYGITGLFKSKPYPGIPEVLHELRAAGAGLFVATSKRTVFAKRILEHIGLASLFEGIYGSEPGGALDEKPELISYILATHDLQAERCIMVGDRRYDVAGAHANGVQSVGALWGYGTREELEKAQADHFAAAPNDILLIGWAGRSGSNDVEQG